MKNPARKCRIFQQIFPYFGDFFFFKFWCFLYSSDPLDPTDVHPYPKPTRPIFPTGRVRVGSKTDLARLMDSSNSSSLDLMSYCSWAKKKTSFRETVGALFSSFFWFHSLYFGYACSVGDALMDLGAHIGI